MPIVHFYYRKILLILFLPLGWSMASGQTSFTANTDVSRVGRDGIVTVEFVINYTSSVEKFTPPRFNKFRLLNGPLQQTGMTSINGAISRYQSYAFTLQPTTTGQLVIGPATAVIDNKSLRSNAVSVSVGNYSSGNTIVPPAGLSPFTMAPEVEEQYMLRPGENLQQKIKDNLIVRLLTNKTSCYEGEPIVAQYELCSRLKSSSRVVKRPSLNGFSVYDMIEPEVNSPEVKKVNGKYFNVHLIRKAQLYPLQPGTFTLEPTELENKVRFLSATSADGRASGPLQDLLDEFQQGNWQEQTVNLSSKPVTINVKPLPEGKPENFNGAVGNFTIEAAFDKGKIVSDKAINFRLAVTGEGNLPLINVPQVDFPDGFEVGEAEVKETLDKTVSPIRGTKTFSYSVLPDSAGDFIVPPVKLSFFNPASARYSTISTDSIRVHVGQGAARKKQNSFGRVVKEDAPVNNFLYLVWLLPLAVIGTAAIVGVLRKPAKKMEEPVAEEIIEVETDPLMQAREALQTDDNKLFYSLLQEAIWQKGSKLLDLKGAEMNKQYLFAALRARNTSPDVVDQLRDVLHECEMALYTPVYTAIDRQKAFEKTEGIFASLASVKE